MTSVDTSSHLSSHRSLPDMLEGAFPGTPPKAYEATSAPLLLEVNDVQLSALHPDLRACVEQIVSLADQKLSEWQAFEIFYPQRKFADGEAVVRLNDLFLVPDNSELMELALDEDGNFKSLTDEQRADARRTGAFVVPSEKYRGQKHVWRVSRILQKGSENIDETHRHQLAGVFDQLIVQIPQRLSWDGEISVGRGLRNIYQGLRAIPAFGLGLIEERPKYSEWDIDQLIMGEQSLVIRQLLVNYQSGDKRLYDEDIVDKLYSVRKKMDADWSAYKYANREDWEQSILTELASEGHLQSSATKEAAIQEKIRQEHYQFITNYAALEEAAEGFGTLIVNELRAAQAVEQVESDFARIRKQQQAEITKEIKEGHRIRSKSDRWLKSAVEKELQKFCEEDLWLRLEEIASNLDSSGHDLEALAYRAMIYVSKDLDPAIRASLKGERVASRTFEFETRIWNSDNWGREEQVRRGETEYTAVKYNTSEVRTDQLFWRLRLIKNETTADFKNGLHNIVVSNLWNGPVGLKSLVLKDPFYAEMKMDSGSGEIVPDEYSETHTLRSRIHALWASSAAARQRFEERPDAGLLPKNFSRGLNMLYYNGILGVGGTALLAAGQPLLTAVNAVASTVATVTSPIWAPLGSVAKFVLAPVVFDSNSPRSSENQRVRRFFPIVGHVVSDIAVAGAGQTLLAASSAAVVHPVTAGVTGIYGELRKWTRTAYDFTMAHAILRRGVNQQPIPG